jgi:TonB-dependent SusC/RagA subfamily outer membrane receptor
MRVTTSLVVPVVLLVAGCTPGTARPAPTPAPYLTAEDIERNTGEPIERVLQVKYPGVQITRSGNGIGLEIRGPGSFYSDVAALYVIDGMAMPAGRGGITGLNPYDIESIKVLRNPEDIGIYGIRGANGVVVITTKHGRKQDD